MPNMVKKYFLKPFNLNKNTRLVEIIIELKNNSGNHKNQKLF